MRVFKAITSRVFITHNKARLTLAGIILLGWFAWPWLPMFGALLAACSYYDFSTALEIDKKERQRILDASWSKIEETLDRDNI